jgi:hypothetical protein
MPTGVKCFLILDLKIGYRKVAVHPTSKEKTAFCTSQELLQFTVIPFGLCYTLATFEQLMESVLQGLT